MRAMRQRVSVAAHAGGAVASSPASLAFAAMRESAAAVGIVDHRALSRGRRWAVLLIVTIGAVVTPSGDPLTLLLLSVPLYIFYEITIWVVRFTVGRKRR